MEIIMAQQNEDWPAFCICAKILLPSDRTQQNVSVVQNSFIS